MKEKVTQEIHHGEMVWVNPLTEAMRREECLCLNCNKLLPSKKGNCPKAEKLYRIAKKENLAMTITRCPDFEQK